MNSTKKTIPTRTRSWVREHSNIIADVALATLGIILKIVSIISAVWGAALVMKIAWLQAGGNPDYLYQLFVIVFAIGGIGTVIVVIYQGERRFAQRIAVRRADVNSRGPARYPTSPHELAVVVQHEARHAVIADVLGYTVTSIETRMSPDIAGNVSWNPPEGMTLADQRWAQALIALAPAGVSSPAPQTDDWKALSYILQIIGAGDTPARVTGPLTFDALLAEAVQQVRELVDEHQNTIDTLALAIRERPLLVGKHLRAAIHWNVEPTKPGFGWDQNRPVARLRETSARA